VQPRIAEVTSEKSLERRRSRRSVGDGAAPIAQGTRDVAAFLFVHPVEKPRFEERDHTQRVLRPGVD